MTIRGWCRALAAAAFEETRAALPWNRLAEIRRTLGLSALASHAEAVEVAFQSRAALEAEAEAPAELVEAEARIVAERREYLRLAHAIVGMDLLDIGGEFEKPEDFDAVLGAVKAKQKRLEERVDYADKRRRDAEAAGREAEAVGKSRLDKILEHEETIALLCADLNREGLTDLSTRRVADGQLRSVLQATIWQLEKQQRRYRLALDELGAEQKRREEAESAASETLAVNAQLLDQLRERGVRIDGAAGMANAYLESDGPAEVDECIELLESIAAILIASDDGTEKAPSPEETAGDFPNSGTYESESGPKTGSGRGRRVMLPSEMDADTLLFHFETSLAGNPCAPSWVEHRWLRAEVKARLEGGKLSDEENARWRAAFDAAVEAHRGLG